jgi:hypothetical protein
VAKPYVVYVNENSHYMDEEERYKLGEFDDCQSAVAACKRIVDEFLEKADNNVSADDLFKEYTTFGEDSWVITSDKDCKFSAWEYAKERCRELARK